MEKRRVRTIDDIIFESAVPPVTLPKGTVYAVEAVTRQGVILCLNDDERFMIDFATFEARFEAVG